MNIKGTIVFQKNWNAIHAINEDGSRKYRYIINKGSSRSSKTYSLNDVYDLYARSLPNKRLTVWRDTKTDCKKTVLKDMLKQLKNTGRYGVNQTFNKTESIFTYFNDSTVEIHGTNDEETVHGLTQDAAWFNEPYKISKDTFDQIDQRTADFVIIDYNPKQGHWVEDLMKDERTIIINSTFKDNPFCPKEMRVKILGYQPVSMSMVVLEKVLSLKEACEYSIVYNKLNLNSKDLKELERCQDNEFKNSANSYKWSVYGLGEKAEKPNRIFKWDEISVQQYQSIEATRYIGNDWGKVDPWAIIEVKYYDGALYVHELNYECEDDIREGMSSTQKAQISGEDDSIVKYMFNKINIDKNIDIICDTNRPNKIAMLRRNGWKKAAGANKGKGSIIDGISIMEDIKIYYTNTSKNIKYEQDNYSRKVDINGKVVEDPEDLDNHTMDAIRYVALYLRSKGIINKL